MTLIGSGIELWLMQGVSEEEILAEVVSQGMDNPKVMMESLAKDLMQALRQKIATQQTDIK